MIIESLFIRPLYYLILFPFPRTTSHFAYGYVYQKTALLTLIYLFNKKTQGRTWAVGSGVHSDKAEP